MTEKKIVLANLNRKQRKARRRLLERHRDGVILACLGVQLESVAGFKRPVPLSNPLPL